MKKSKLIQQFIIPILLILLFQVVILSVIFVSFYRNEAAEIKNLGLSNLRSQSTMIENYVDNGKDVIWLAADTVDFMLIHGSDHEEIKEYLEKATGQMKTRFDANFTGIYGLVDGEYLDGTEWEPPEGYDPHTREWYTCAAEAGGKPAITRPYVDAQTGQTIISFAQMLSDGESVVALDIVLDEVQHTVEEMTIDESGYGFIIDEEGMVIAHSDPTQLGSCYSEDPEMAGTINKVRENKSDYFDTWLNGEHCTVFSENIVESWYVVIVVTNTKLFASLRLWVSIASLMILVTLIVLVIFCVISIRKIVEAEEKEIRSREKLEQVNMSIIRSLVSTIDAKDTYTSGHSQRVAEYSREIAKRMGKSEEDQQIVFYAGLLHDVGKIRVPDSVINKDGKLTDEEFDKIRMHPVSGFHILMNINEDERIGYGTKYHHERFDGKGYPNGLAEKNIPEVARIIAVADAYDAMTSNRSYRNALPQDVVRNEILKGRGRQFDPAIADIMLEIMNEDKDFLKREMERGTWNVLVVDDEHMNLSMVEHIFSGIKNVNLITACNADEAHAKLKENDISLVLLDLMMPGVDGFTLFKQIREKYTMPVILMTSEKSSDTLKKIRELGIDDYLTKPLNAVITLESVRGILRSGRV